MALIPVDEYATLKSASEVKSVADSSQLEYEKMSIAKLINSSANSGQYEILYNHDISEAMLDALKGQGYKVTRRPLPDHANNPFQFIIRWK